MGTQSPTNKSNRPASLLIFVGVLIVCSAPLRAQNDATSLNDLHHLAWSTDSTGPRRFVSVHGRRAAIFGYSRPTDADASTGGLEVWAYPIQILRSYNVAFRPRGATTAINGETVLRRIVYSPDAITRIYAGPDFVIREKLFVPLDESGVIFRYEVDGAMPPDIDVRFVPVLDLMWPASIGGQKTVWNSNASGYFLFELTHRFTAIVQSPDIVAHDDTPNISQPVGRDPGVAFTIRPSKNNSAHVIIASGVQEKDVTAIASRLTQNEGALQKASVDHYSELMNDVMRIQTPDAEINRALDWSEIAIDQAWVCNPDLGCGIVAGYGPSRKARRPQYDWFFAGDGMVAIRELLASGQYQRAREQLEFILKFQDQKTGMIWHEMSQSAALLDWDKYPYKFAHVDLTFDFLNTVANYSSVTGDRDFPIHHWASIQSAFDYCVTLIDPKDGLPRIPADKEGGNEQDALIDELSLSVSWATAARSFSALASATAHLDEAKKADLLAEAATRAIVPRYWNGQTHSWISGYTRSGRPLLHKGLAPCRVNGALLLPETQLDSLLDSVASADFQTDWGTRSNASSAKTYDPDSYSRGSVWATHTSSTALEFWSQHRPATAWPIWSSLVPWSSLDSLGHMHEVLAGNYYHEELESVPEQTWSSAEFFASAVHGLLGIEVDGVSNRVTLAPHLPANWASVVIQNLRVGNSRLTATIAQHPNEVRLDVQNDGVPVEMLFDPEIPLGAELKAATLGNQLIPAILENYSQDTQASIKATLPHGNSTLVIRYAGGISIVTDRPQPMIGDFSHAIKITGVHLDGSLYSVDFDCFPPEVSGFNVLTPWKIKDAEGGRIAKISPSSYHVTISTPADRNNPAIPRHGRVVLRLERAESR